VKYEQIIAGFRALQTSVMERLPDVDLGSPGPLVHTLERVARLRRRTDALCPPSAIPTGRGIPSMTIGMRTHRVAVIECLRSK
jgi:hypothetical protein